MFPTIKFKQAIIIKSQIRLYYLLFLPAIIDPVDNLAIL